MAITGGASKAMMTSPYSGSSTDDDLPSRQKQRSPKAGSFIDSEASDDTENNEKGSEICQLGEETCLVPIDLFDLPDLNKILSLDSWNFCLTEEEREYLVSFLPPTDEDDFRLTIRDLLGGQNFHFGSPLADLFEKLKSGSCTPGVARYNEGLKYVARKKHYHLLKKYHNQMVNSFLEMQKSWEHCPKSADIEERLGIWSSWKEDKLKPPPPTKIRGGNGRKPRVVQPNVGKKMVNLLPEPRRVEVIAQVPATLSSPPVLAPSAMATGASRMASKGVLKMKVIAPKSDLVGGSRPGSVREPEAVKVPAPKGVLKLTSKALVQGYAKPEPSAAGNEKIVMVEPKREPVVKEARAPRVLKAPRVTKAPRVPKEPKVPKAPREPKPQKVAVKVYKDPYEFDNVDDVRSMPEYQPEKKKRNAGERKRKQNVEEEEKVEAERVEAERMEAERMEAERMEAERSASEEMYEGQRMYGESQRMYQQEGHMLYEEPESIPEDGRRKKKVKVYQEQGMHEGGYQIYDGGQRFYDEVKVLPQEGRKKKNMKVIQEQLMYEEEQQAYEQDHSPYEEAGVVPDEGRKKKKVKVNQEQWMYGDGHQTYEVSEAVPEDGRKRKNVKVSQGSLNRPEDGRKVKKGRAPAGAKAVDEVKSSIPGKKVQRRKPSDVKKKAQEIMDMIDAEEAEEAERNLKLSDLMNEELHYQHEQPDSLDDEIPKPAPRKRAKKKAKDPRDEAFLHDSAPGSPRERGASVVYGM